MIDAAHTCHVYESSEEAVEVAIRFLAEGLAAGERCAFVGPEEARAAIGEALTRSRGARDDAVLLLGDDEVFLAEGVFDPEDSSESLRDAAQAARASGFARLRVVSDTSRVLPASPGFEALIEYAARFDAIVREAGMLALCQYDRRALPPDIVRGAIRVHEHVLHGGMLLRNLHAVPPAALLQRETAEAEVERLLSALHAREEAETALRDGQERYRSLVTSLSEGIVSFALDGAVIECNPAAERILGVDRAALLRRTTRDGGWWTIRPDGTPLPDAEYPVAVTARTGAPLRGVVMGVRRPDGELRWLSVNSEPIVTPGDERPRAVVTSFFDVTAERRAHEEAVQREERLRIADRLASVGTLAAGVAHEINNPLAFVTSNVGYVRDELARIARIARGGEAARAAALAQLDDALRDALDGTARVRGIVQGLRQFAQPARDAARVPIDVRAEIAAAVRLARNEIAHRATLALDLPEELPAVVAAPHELGQIVVNLLVNAAQAIPEGRAAWNEVRVSARAGGGKVTLEVHDSGAGIPAEALPHIFDPFFTTKPVGSGTGLGLSICHGVVVALGGTIDVETSAGGGTTFRVVLPAAARAGAVAAPVPAIAPAPRRARVLVVDDEPLVGRSLVRLLQSAHDVTAVVSPAEVVARVAAGERWDVVLCDLMMPDMSGMDLEARIQEAAPEVVGRIVYMTGGAFTERARTFLDEGRPWLEKPIDAAVLKAKIAEVAAGSRGSAA